MPVVLFRSYMAQSVIYNLHCRPTRRSWLFQEAYMSSYMAHVFLHGAIGRCKKPTCLPTWRMSSYIAQSVVARNLHVGSLQPTLSTYVAQLVETYVQETYVLQETCTYYSS